MDNFLAVNKLLGENVATTLHMQSREMRLRPKDWNYCSLRKIFCNNLKSKGYEVIVDGNYITATYNNNETVRFYFTAHNTQNSNYLITTVLKNKVDYFAFYNNKIDAVYLVGYGIVREYCKKIKTAYRFYGNRQSKMFIPDSWAKEQRINTMLLY